MSNAAFGIQSQVQGMGKATNTIGAMELLVLEISGDYSGRSPQR